MNRFLAIAVLLLAISSIRAGDPALTPLQPIEPPPAYYRVSMYDRWQYYAVDRSGQFRARVVFDMPEPFYLVNGRPYPLLPVRQMDFIPHIID